MSTWPTLRTIPEAAARRRGDQLREALWSLRCECIETGAWRNLHPEVRAEVIRALDETKREP